MMQYSSTAAQTTASKMTVNWNQKLFSSLTDVWGQSQYRFWEVKNSYVHMLALI